MRTAWQRWWGWAVDGMAVEVRAALRRHDLSLLAAGVTFYAALAVVPLAVVSLRLAGWIGGDHVVRSLARTVNIFLRPGNASDVSQALANAALRVPWPVLVASVLPASLYSDGLRRAFARVAPEPGESGLRRAIRSRVLALCGFLFLPVALLALATGGSALTDGRLPVALGVYLAFLVGWALATAALFVTYRIGAASDLPPRALLMGAAATGSMVSGMVLGLVLVLRLPLNFGRAYGGFTSAGVAATIAGWLWLLHAVVLVGLAYTRRLADRQPPRR